MLEFLSVIGIIAISFIAFTFAKFQGFKKRLMSEFSQRGISYRTANDAYFHAADFANSMNADGKTAVEIADEMMKRYPELFR